MTETLSICSLITAEYLQCLQVFYVRLACEVVKVHISMSSSCREFKSALNLNLGLCDVCVATKMLVQYDRLLLNTMYGVVGSHSCPQPGAKFRNYYQTKVIISTIQDKTLAETLSSSSSRDSGTGDALGARAPQIMNQIMFLLKTLYSCPL